MRTAATGCEFDQLLNSLARATTAWLERHHPADPAMLLLSYEREAQAGLFRHFYAALCDDSLEFITGRYPLMTLRLAGIFARATGLSVMKCRLAVNLLLYWILLFHTQRQPLMPGDSDKALALRSLLLKPAFTF